MDVILVLPNTTPGALNSMEPGGTVIILIMLLLLYTNTKYQIGYMQNCGIQTL